MMVPTTNGRDELEGGERPSKVGDHYEVIRKVGEGSFGVIYLGRTDLSSDLVAIKFESRKSNVPQLRDEYRAYKLLNASIQSEIREGKNLDKDLTRGIPRAYFYGTESLFNYMIIDYLGPSLEDIFDMCDRRFSVKTTCYLAIEIISRVQTIHKYGLIYRDIKPDNFLLGRGNQNGSTGSALKKKNSLSRDSVVSDDNSRPVVYIVDFGMAKHYRDPRTLQHIPYREKKSLSGTARYMAINTHLGREQSRRDDLEAVGNVLMYFLRGSLPWQGLKARDNREKYEKIGQRKQAIKISDLCGAFPDCFSRFVTYTRRLAFEEDPDYESCKAWFREVYAAQDANEPLDWERLGDGNGKSFDVNQRRQDGVAGGNPMYESPGSVPNHLPWSLARRANVNTNEVNDNKKDCVATRGQMPTEKDHIIVGQSSADSKSKKEQGIFRRIFCSCI